MSFTSCYYNKNNTEFTFTASTSSYFLEHPLLSHPPAPATGRLSLARRSANQLPAQPCEGRPIGTVRLCSETLVPHSQRVTAARTSRAAGGQGERQEVRRQETGDNAAEPQDAGWRRSSGAEQRQSDKRRSESHGLWGAGGQSGDNQEDVCRAWWQSAHGFSRPLPPGVFHLSLWHRVSTFTFHRHCDPTGSLGGSRARAKVVCPAASSWCVRLGWHVRSCLIDGRCVECLWRTRVVLHEYYAQYFKESVFCQSSSILTLYYDISLFELLQIFVIYQQFKTCLLILQHFIIWQFSYWIINSSSIIYEKMLLCAHLAMSKYMLQCKLNKKKDFTIEDQSFSVDRWVDYLTNPFSSSEVSFPWTSVHVPHSPHCSLFVEGERWDPTGKRLKATKETVSPFL